MNDNLKATIGVGELIGRLKDEGVEAGKNKADQALRDAEKKASGILSQAKSEAEDIVAKAKAVAEAERQESREALKIAVRDTILTLKEQINLRFRDQVKRLVAEDLGDADFLKKLILAVAEHAVSQDGEEKAYEILFSGEYKKELDSFIHSVMQDMFKKGIEVKPLGDHSCGIKLRLKGEDMEIDLTDKILSDLILKFLVPRFRAMVEGVDQ
jgi:V/A-type H+-transporting ATPase subunit E